MSDAALRKAFKAIRELFLRFASEYEPNGVLHAPTDSVKALARICPSNNDCSERSLGTFSYFRSQVSVVQSIPNVETRTLARQNQSIEWLLSLPPEEALRVMRVARRCSAAHQQKQAEYNEGVECDQRARMAAVTAARAVRIQKKIKTVLKNEARELWSVDG